MHFTLQVTCVVVEMNKSGLFKKISGSFTPAESARDIIIWPRGYTTFFLCSTQSRMKYFQLINVKVVICGKYINLNKIAKI